MKRLALLWIIVVFFGTSCLEAGQKSPTSKKDYLQGFRSGCPVGFRWGWSVDASM